VVSDLWNFLSVILSFLGDVGSSAWELVDAALPSIVAAVALIVLLRSFRYGVLRIRRRSPRVQVTQFAWTGAGEGREALWITSLFRDHLKALRLDGLDPLPDRAPGSPLVEIVEGVGQGASQSRDLARALGRLLRAALPDCSYEVWATLRPSGDGEGSISVQLVERRRGNRSLANVTTEQGTWEKVTRQAAMAVSGALYPQLSNRHKGPWSRWRKPVPAELLGKYQDALRHEREDRLEQALGGFRDALRMDPLNPDLRLKVAMLEERLELHLDAWYTYRAIVDERDRALWKGPQRRARLIALYRLAIHLGNPAVADQWVELPNVDPGAAEGTGDEMGRIADAHDREQLKMRRLLRTGLRKDWFLGDERELKPRPDAVNATAAGLIDALATTRCREEGRARAARSELVGPFLANSRRGDLEKRKRQIGEVLQVMSLRYLEELDDRMRRVRGHRSGDNWQERLRRRPPFGRWLRRREFSSRMVGVTVLLTRCRIAAAAEYRLENVLGQGREVLALRCEHNALLRRWPIGIEGNRRLRHWRLRAWIWFTDFLREDSWVLHYNAACTIAVLLAPGTILRDQTETSRRERARDAIAQLEAFAHRARSGHVAQMADWIVAGDPDLAGLHGFSEFRLWASHHLGFALPPTRRRRVVDTDRYTVLVILRGAKALAGKWRERAGSGPIPAEKLVGWWREEREIWEGMAHVLKERRSWRARLDALNELERWNEANDLDAVDLGHEAWDVGKERLELSGTFLLHLSIRVGADGPLLGWVRARAEGTRAEQDARLQGARGGTVEMSLRDRAAAVKAAETWSQLAAVLEEALEKGAAAAVTGVGAHLPAA
jgi:hypothetical protein